MTVFFYRLTLFRAKKCIADTFKSLFCSKIHKMIFVHKDKNNKCHFPFILKVCFKTDWISHFSLD